MLNIRFYNIHQKYIDQIEPFPNGEINKRIQEARELAIRRTDISGWTVYEQVGGCWLPYRPFNRCTRYDIGQKVFAPIT